VCSLGPSLHCEAALGGLSQGRRLFSARLLLQGGAKAGDYYGQAAFGGRSQGRRFFIARLLLQGGAKAGGHRRLERRQEGQRPGGLVF